MNKSFYLSWDAELIKLALEWKPHENGKSNVFLNDNPSLNFWRIVQIKQPFEVIFGVGLRVQENEYSKLLQASASSRTIFIVNPCERITFFFK